MAGSAAAQSTRRHDAAAPHTAPHCGLEGGRGRNASHQDLDIFAAEIKYLSNRCANVSPQVRI